MKSRVNYVIKKEIVILIISQQVILIELVQLKGIHTS